MKYLKSKLFTSLFATLLILSFCMAKPAQVHASNADSAKMARWMSICSSMADNIEKKHFVYSNGGTARTYNSAVKRSRRSNCALYVSWCLQKYGALGSGQTFYIRRGSSSIRKNFGHWKKKKVQVIRVNKRASRVNLKKGDVVLWSDLDTQTFTLVRILLVNAYGLTLVKLPHMVTTQEAALTISERKLRDI